MSALSLEKKSASRRRLQSELSAQQRKGMNVLRNYQKQLVHDARIAFKRNRRVLLQLPTGAGKTIVAAAIANTIPGKVLFFSHRDNHLANWIRAMGAYEEDPSAHMVTARTYPKLKPALLVVDEAHHCAKGRLQYDRLLAAYPRAKVLGLTATPQRLDGLPLSDVFDTLIQGPSTVELQRDGFIARPRYYGVPAAERARLVDIHVRSREYDRRELSSASRVLVGLVVKEWMRRGRGLPTIAFAVDVEHAKSLVAAFRRAKVKSRLIAGTEVSTEYREQARADLKSGALEVMVTVDMLGEGWDCPEARCAILARPTKSLALHLQQCGRVMRPGPVRPVILDHAGNLESLGYPESIYDWSLEGSKTSLKDRLGRESSEEREKECPECGNTCAALVRICPACGYRWSSREIREVETELRELRAAAEPARAPLICAYPGCGKELHADARSHGTKHCYEHANVLRRKPPVVCAYPGCGKELHAGARSRGNTFCITHAHMLLRKPPVVCAYPGCGKELCRTARSVGAKHCFEHAHMLRRKPPVVCAYPGCGKELGRTARSLGTKHCVEHAYTIRRKDPVICAYPGCGKELNHSARVKGTKHCSEHSGMLRRKALASGRPKQT